MVRKFFIFLLYCLCALCILGAILVIFVPRERIAGWAAQMVESRMSGYECSIDDIRYVYPLKIRLYRIHLSDDSRGIHIPIDTMLISFAAEYPIEKIGVSGVLFGGDVSGDVRLDNLTSSGNVGIDNLNVSRIHLGDIGMVQSGFDRPVHGIVSFTGRAVIDPNNLDDVRLTGAMRVRNFSTILDKPILENNEIEFDDITADVSFSSETLQFADGRISSRLFTGDLAGTLKFSPMWKDSAIDLSGTLTSQPDVQNTTSRADNSLELQYEITGTLGDPQGQIVHK